MIRWLAVLPCEEKLIELGFFSLEKTPWCPAPITAITAHPNALLSLLQMTPPVSHYLWH